MSVFASPVTQNDSRAKYLPFSGIRQFYQALNRQTGRINTLLLCFIWLFAAEAGEDILTKQERAWLQAHPVIRIVPDPDFPPIESLSSDGQYTGIAADHIRLLEKKLDIRFEIIRPSSWDEALKMAKKRSADMFSAAASTATRREYMNFTRPHLELPGVILVRKRISDNMSLKDLNHLKVAVVSGYVWQELISRDYPNIDLKPVPDLLTGLKKVSFGSVDAMVANLATATHYIEIAGITNLRVAGESGYYGRYAFAVRKDWPELIGILEKGISTITRTERANILNKWIRVQLPGLLTYRSFWISLVSALLVTLAIMILVWNWTLRKRVTIRTAELREELFQRKRAEKAYQYSERRYQTLFNAAPDAIFLLEGNNFVDCNNAATILFACNKEDFHLHPPYHFSPRKQADGMASHEKAVMLIEKAMQGEDQRLEWRHQRTNGDEFDAEINLIAYDAGKHHYILAIVRDITERKRIERLKDEFISTVSHEIRTPLTSIRGSLGLITKKAVDRRSDESEQLLDIAYENSERLLLLVNDLLDIQKLESGAMQLNLQLTPVTGFLENAVSANRSYGEQYNVKFNLIPSHDQYYIMADYDRLMQIMNNLLSNAAKFSSQGDSVEIRSKRHNNMLRISVCDHGCGIPLQFQQYVFERFTQADASDSRPAGGTGLGLSIAKSIIEHHGGTIVFHSDGKTGSEFYFDIPLAD